RAGAMVPRRVGRGRLRDGAQDVGSGPAAGAGAPRHEAWTRNLRLHGAVAAPPASAPEPGRLQAPREPRELAVATLTGDRGQRETGLRMSRAAFRRPSFTGRGVQPRRRAAKSAR